MEKLLNYGAIQGVLAERGITQKQLASAVGTSSQAVTNWLKGKDFPRPASLLKLATTLGLTFDQLVQTSNVGRHVIAYRKKANDKTTDAHIAKAEGIGMLLKPLVAHLPELQALRTLITSPSTDYEKLQVAASQTRSRVGVLEDVAEQRRDAGVFGHLGNAFAVEAEHLVAPQAAIHELRPAVAGGVAGEELALAAEFLAFGVHVVHELVDQGGGDLLDLGFGVMDFADEDVAGGVDAAFGIGVEHYFKRFMVLSAS